MFSHVVVGFSDFHRALKFYRGIMPLLGFEERFVEEGRPWAGWQERSEPRPLFLIAKPFDGTAHIAGNGQMTAFMARTRETVDEVFAVAMANGGMPEGSPGIRAQYHDDYYGAYFRDTEGNKICVVCHSAVSGPSNEGGSF